jgi:hypothetical protein
MRYDQQAIANAQRRSFQALSSPFFEDGHGKQMVDTNNKPIPNPYFVNPLSISEPAQIIQELPFVNSQNAFIFDFSLTAPQATQFLGNIALGKNNVLAQYAFQFFLGYGAAANNRVYQSFGNIQADDSIYDGVLQMKMEQETLVDLVPMRKFKDVGQSATEFDPNMGMVLTNPVRLINGNLGRFQIIINLTNPINNLILSPNLFLSMRMEGSFGQASSIATKH